eukprot:m51a1_g13496 hypothetical protein (218) ;mRNA; r:283-1319
MVEVEFFARSRHYYPCNEYRIASFRMGKNNEPWHWPVGQRTDLSRAAELFRDDNISVRESLCEASGSQVLVGSFTSGEIAFVASTAKFELLKRQGHPTEMIAAPPDIVWKSMAFTSTIRNVLIADVTMIDEHGESLLAATRAACFVPETSAHVAYDELEGQNLECQIHNISGRGGVLGVVLTSTEGSGHSECAILHLWVGVALKDLNAWFSTRYTSG